MGNTGGILPSKPDIVLPKYKTLIFVHGCFWHGQEGCKYFKIPETRTEWWKNKIETNIKVDLRNYSEFKKIGWKILTIWECELKKANRLDTFSKILQFLTL